ncbi:LysR family transcriptional regulator [Microbacterium sp. T32]|uniref:LysR family transcriptional regulator n=2 Tax=Bacillati TaxID=1783272 RepID=UPI000A3EDF4E|nr:LysR family transcriptional regulator [Microbacterium sp. T32]
MNLLLGLDALLENRSVQDAATQMRLTPPAVSRILSRLRAATGDDILVRNGRRMVPTARALELQSEVRDLVARAEAVLTPARDFRLADLHRTFVVRCHESLVAPVATRLSAIVASEASGLQVRFVAEKADDDRDLTRGHLDLEIGDAPAPSATVRSRVVSTDTMRLIVRRHSELDVDHPTAEAIAGALHVNISRRGRTHGPIDDRLFDLGLRRRVIATVPAVGAALSILETVPAVTALPERVAQDLPSSLVSRPFPFPLSAAPIALSWHARHDNDPAHSWLRGVCTQALAPTTV